MASCIPLPAHQPVHGERLVDGARIAQRLQDSRESAAPTPILNAAEAATPTAQPAQPPTLSKRAEHGLSHRSELMNRFLKLFSDSWSSENPNGMVNLGVAENTLMHDELQKYFERIPGCELQSSDFTYGNSLTGSKRLFDALASFFSSYFAPARPVLPSQMVAGVGLSAIIDQLTGLLCDEGEGVMIAAPYYNGFDNDIRARCLCEPIAVQIPDGVDPSSVASVRALDEKMRAIRDNLAKGEGKDTRAVIVCNPHNPLGFCYPRETLLEYCRLAEKYNLHLIVDEIYALSVYRNCCMKEARPFISMLSIDPLREAGCDPSRVHVLYGMSKDFCCNGLRMGALVSQSNPRLIDAFTNSALFMKVASPADALWSSILNKPDLLSWFIQENQARLAEARSFAAGWLKAHKIPHVETNAGHFMLLDLRRFLPSVDSTGREITQPREQEGLLLLHLLDQGIHIAPGAAYHHPTPGFFRLTFSLQREYMELGLSRLERALGMETTGRRPFEPVSGKLSAAKVSEKEVKQVTEELAEGLMCQCFV